MPDMNVFTRASQRLADKMAQAQEEAKKSKGIPFGMERVSADVEAQAFMQMNREEKDKFMASHTTRDDPKGVAYVMKVIQRGQKLA